MPVIYDELNQKQRCIYQVLSQSPNMPFEKAMSYLSLSFVVNIRPVPFLGCWAATEKGA